MRKTLVIGSMILFSMSACQQSQAPENGNPLLADWNTPHQTAPFDQIKTEHFIPAIDAALEEARAEVDQLINNTDEPTFENTIEALELGGKKLSRVVGVLYNLNSAETSDELQAVAREISPKMSEFSNYVSLNEQLFERVKTIYAKKDELGLNEEQMKLLERKYKGFVRSGANLEGEAKKRYAEITTELSKLGLEFGEHVLAETNAYSLLITDEKDLAGLPQGIRMMAAGLAKSKGKEGWMFNLQYPSFVPFMKYAENRALREEVYRAYTSRAYKDNENNNEEVIRNLVNLRLEKAQLLGFKTYADFVLAERMAETPERVNQFLEDLHKASKPVAEKEYKEVEAYAIKKGLTPPLQRWDWTYYSEQLKAEKFGFNQEQVKPYFQLEKVSQGIFDLATTLYGLTFKENKEIQVYNQEVKAYEVYNADGSFLSILYMDFFPRDGKRGGAWMNDFRPQSNLHGEEIRPIITVVTNFSRPTEDAPALLTFGEVTTLLHEFGHALHGMLANTTYASMSGTNVYRDFVELPSQIMENYATEKEWLDKIAIHYETGEQIPADLVEKLIAARNYNAGYASERQLSFGMNDMAWHSITKPVTEGVVEFENRALAATELFPAVEGSCLSSAFSHIFSGGYAAGYYGYKWAEVLDADAFSLFQKNGIFDKATAQSFRTNVLERGGTEHPMTLYKAFRGQEPTVDALLERSGLN